MPNAVNIVTFLMTGCAQDHTLTQASSSQDTATQFESGDFSYSADGLCDDLNITPGASKIQNICPTVLRPDGKTPPEDTNNDGVDDACQDYFAQAQSDLAVSIAATAGADILDGCPSLTYHLKASATQNADAFTRRATLWLIFDDAVSEIKSKDYQDCDTALPQTALCLDLNATQPAAELAALSSQDKGAARQYEFSITAVGPKGPDQEVSLAFGADKEVGDPQDTVDAQLHVGAQVYENNATYSIDAGLFSGAAMMDSVFDSLAGLCDFEWSDATIPVCEDSVE